MTWYPLVLRSLLIGSLLATMAAIFPALGEERPALRASISVDGPLVTLGDLIHGAGEAASTAVFRSPDPGTTGTVSAARVRAAAAERGLSLADDHLAAVTVTRASRAVSSEDVADLIAKRLVAEGRAADMGSVEIRLDSFERALHVESRAVAPLEIRSLDHDRASGRFSALLAIADSSIAAAGVRISGRAIEVVDVPVPVRAVRRGETIRSADLSIQRIMRTQLRTDTVVDTGEIVGRAARRGLRAGVPIGSDSLMAPILVSRNETVTIVYRVPGLALTARGRAIAAGSKGDLVTVINSQSNRTLEAEVTGAGVVEVTASGGSGSLHAAR